VFLSDDVRRRIVDHCVSALPNEGCGLLAVDGDRVVEVYPTENEDSSPHSFTIPPQEHYDALVDAESRGWVIGGVFHSHPDGPAEMSSIDLARALDKDWIYVVVNLEGDAPEMRTATVT